MLPLHTYVNVVTNVLLFDCSDELLSYLLHIITIINDNDSDKILYGDY